MRDTRISRIAAAAIVSLSAAAAFVVGACGSDGEKGETGAMGAPGPAGPVGPTGPAGSSVFPDAGTGALSGACTTPCHTFNGVVDQWRFSNHSHPQENEIGGGACGNCHALDGLQQRRANVYSVPPDAGVAQGVPNGHISYRAANGSTSEISYGGATTIGKIACSTCHAFDATNDPHVTGKYTPGSAPIRVPGGVSDTAMIEKSESGATQTTGQSVSYRRGNVCVFCHKSRKDVTFYVTASNPISNARWGPHEGPVSDVYSAKGGYHFAGQTYSSSAHVTDPRMADACVACHMRPVKANGDVPDHTMKPTVEFCRSCHTSYTGTDFDVQGGRTLVRKALTELQTLLDGRGLLTRAEVAPYGALDADEIGDGQFHLDKSRPGTGPGGANQVLDAATAGALYNYFIIARSKDLGVHNPTYTKQLLWDSIKQVSPGNANPTSLPGGRPL